MRNPCAHLLLLGVVLFGASCTNEASVPAFISTRYQIRCLDACEVNETPHSVANVDGEDDLELTCRVADGALNFRLACPGDDESGCGRREFALEVTNARIDDEGEISDPGGPCRVLATEGSNSYTGGCTSGDPSADRPCYISGEVDGTFIRGELLCRNFSNRVNASDKRSLVAPSTGNTVEPVAFTLEGCEGL